MNGWQFQMTKTSSEEGGTKRKSHFIMMKRTVGDKEHLACL